MMKNESEIFAQIKQSLDTYQEDYIPGSWENYLQKSKARKRKLFMRIASGIAACLLMGFVGSELIFKVNLDSPLITARQAASGASQQTLEPVVNNKSGETSNKLGVNPGISPSTSLAAVVTGHKTRKPAGAESKADPDVRYNLMATKENATSVNQIATNIVTDSINKIANRSENTVFQANNKSDSLKNFRDTIRVRTKFTVPDAQPKTENQNLADSHRRKVRFGLNCSPGVSTAKSSNSFNFTGGLSADISLFSNFQLTTGLQVENQNIAQKNPGMASSSYASSSIASTPSALAAPAIQSSTKMINLDVPVNITWKFFSEKTNSYYVSAGLSSLVYLRQNNKNTTYSQYLVPVSSVVGGTEVKSYDVINQVAVSENTGTPAQVFDFAGRVNIMVGFEKKLSNKLFIHVEPYAKIPASGLAPGNLNHTSTGINFKISF